MHAFRLSLMLVVALSRMGGQLQACDVCGCSAGGYFIGIMPQFQRNFAGVRYQYQQYRVRAYGTEAAALDHFQRAEVWMRWYPAPKWQIMGFVPGAYNIRLQDTARFVRQGLGDVSLLVHYQVFNNQADTAVKVKHSLMVGAGVKLPTGAYTYTETETQVAHPNFQLGTGSADVVVRAVHTLRYNSWGLNTDLTAKLNTANPSGYRFGHRLTGVASAFWVRRLSAGLAIMPNAGYFAEYMAQDIDQGTPNRFTGGWTTFGVGGIELYTRRVSAGFSAQLPLAQHLSGGDMTAGRRGLAHVTLML